MASMSIGYKEFVSSPFLNESNLDFVKDTSGVLYTRMQIFRVERKVLLDERGIREIGENTAEKMGEHMGEERFESKRTAKYEAGDVKHAEVRRRKHPCMWAFLNFA